MTEIIEIIEQGPQGPVGIQVQLLVVYSTVVIPIPQHDNTEPTEITLVVDDFNDGVLDLTSGEITVLQTLDLSQVIVEVFLEKTGGSGQIAVFSIWTESSVDSGVSWRLVEDTLRSVSINNDSEGFHLYEMSLDGLVPAGIMFRMKGTNTGSGTLSRQPSTSITTSRGVVDGHSAKFSIMYRVTNV